MHILVTVYSSSLQATVLRVLHNSASFDGAALLILACYIIAMIFKLLYLALVGLFDTCTVVPGKCSCWPKLRVMIK